MPVVAGGGRAHGARQLQSGDDHDRRGDRRHDLHRAADGARAGAHHRAREAGRPAADAGRADGAKPGRRPGRRRRAGEVRPALAGDADRDDPHGRGPRSIRQAAGGDRRAGAGQRNGDDGGGSAPRREGDRPAADRPSGVHAGRHGRRHRANARRAGADRARRAGGVADRPGAAGALPAGLEGDRVRGDARRRRQLHHRLQHGEHRPDGRAHGRLDRRRAQPDAAGQGIPDAALGVAQDHPRAGHRGRLQHPVRAGAAQGDRRVGAAGRRSAAVLRDRGQPARVTQLGAGVEGDGLPDRARGGEDRSGQDAGRDPEPRDRQDDGCVRAGAGLLRGQDTALAVRQVPAGRAPHRHTDEVDRRGDGDRPHVRGGAGESGALAGVRRALAAVGGPGVARHRPPRLRGDPDGRAAVGRAGVAAARRDGRRAVGAVGDRPVVPDEDGTHRRG